MPFLLGRIDKSGRPDVTAETMVHRLGRVRSSHRIHQLSSFSAALASDELANPLWGPRVAANGEGIVAGLNGEVFSLAGEDGTTSETFCRGPSSRPALLLIDLYQRYGISFVSRLRGAFSLAIWDAHTQTLYLATDRYGMRPMYYRHSEEEILFASEVKALLSELGTRATVDEQGITDFLLLGMPLGNRTFFRDIRLVPRSTVLEFRGSSTTEKPYWDLRFCGGPRVFAGLNDVTRDFREAFLGAFEEIASHPDVLHIPLSGGLDSRCLAAATRFCGKEAQTYTAGLEGSGDLRLGPAAAGTLGFQNHSWCADGGDFVDLVEEAVYLTDGMLNPVDSWILFIAKRLPPDAQVVLDGTNSFDGYYRLLELPFSYLYPARYSSIKLALRVLNSPLVDSAGRVTGSFLAPDYAALAQDLVRETLDEFLSDVPEDQRRSPFDLIDFLDQGTRVRRFNMMGTVLLRSVCEVRHPFFDNRVVDAVTQLAPRFRSKEKLVIGRLLRELDPNVASLPYERTGLPADSHALRHLLAYALKGTRRLGGTLLPAWRVKPPAEPYLGTWVLNSPRLERFVRDILLDGKTQRRGFFRPEAVSGLVEGLFKGDTRLLALVGRMLSLELWHRYFLEGESPL